jgi:hypothetical protein
MTTYTLAQLRNRVLQELGVLSGTETATAEDADLVDTVIADIHDMLDREVYLTWVSSAIPSTVMEPLVLIVAARVAGRFGLPDSRRAELWTLHGAAMGEIRTQVQAEENDAPVRAVYY